MNTEKKRFTQKKKVLNLLFFFSPFIGYSTKQHFFSFLLNIF